MGSESFRIDSVDQYQQVKQALSKKNQPGRVMRFLMNAMESYRQARKYGWSRPWNKYDLTVFQSFKLKTSRDSEIFALARQLLQNSLAMPSTASRFADELLENEKTLMGYLFVHDYQDPDEKQYYEGITLSLGRVNNKKYRDRIDLIFESPVVDGVSQGLSRVRVYVDPFLGVKAPLWSTVLKTNLPDTLPKAFEQLCQYSWEWASDDDKLWNHWTEKYIDYFGPRKHALKQTYLYQADMPETRVQVNSQEKAA